MVNKKNIPPIWKRIGFENPPVFNQSGKNIGIIIIDKIIPHNVIKHLKDRLFIVKEDSYDQFKLEKVFETKLFKNVPKSAEHGMSSLLLLAHNKIKIEDKIHIGLCPKANFIFINTSDFTTIKRKLSWILKNKKDKYNIKVVLSTMVPPVELSFKDPYKYSRQNMLKPVINEDDIILVSANGNSKAHNNLHPKEFFSIGGYIDINKNGCRIDKIHPVSLYGFNSEGDLRPDLLAPFTYLPIPDFKNSNTRLDFFAGTSGASTIVAGVCANLLSRNTDIKVSSLKVYLSSSINVLECGDFVFPKLDLNAINEIKERNINIEKITYLSQDKKLHYKNLNQQGKELTKKIERNIISRDKLWDSLKDDNYIVNKVALWGLGEITDVRERTQMWDLVSEFKNKNDKIKYGVLESMLIKLSRNSTKNEIDNWIDLIEVEEINIFNEIYRYLSKYYSEVPKVQHSPYPDYISKARPKTYNWYKNNIDK